MRRIAASCCVAALLACSPSKEQPATDEVADAPPPAPATASIALSDVAGKWAINVMAEGSDSAILKFEMVATGDTSGWAFNFPKRKPVSLRIVAVEGDSIVTEAGPFDSNLRKGVKVTSRTVTRLQDGKLVGVTTAHYATDKPDSVVQLRFEGTRAQ